jgi:tetratricopeptide (TPR) repeat protein
MRTFFVPGQKIAWTPLLVAMLAFAGFAHGAETPELETAIRPLEQVVPEVSIVRLRAFLSGTPGEAQRRAANAKLAEALVAAGQPEEALNVIENSGLTDDPAMQFHKAQARAALGQWSEALLLFQKISSDVAAPFHSEARFGQAEALRALGRRAEASRVLESLFADQKWSVRAQLRAIELLLEKNDNAKARRLLDTTRPQSLADKKEKRFLQARWEIQSGRRERGLELYQTIAHRPEGASRAVLVATLCGLADATLQLRTPEVGESALEDFVDRHPSDPELHTIFAKLDQLYQAEPKPSRHDFGKWANDPIQPRRSFGQWFLARNELRAGRRDAALQAFGEMRASPARLPDLAEGFLEFARFELEERRFEEALQILEEARALQPRGPLLNTINLLAARVEYESGHFELAAEAFEQVARTSPRFATDSRFNASLAWMQLGNNTRFLTDYRELTQQTGGEEARGDLLLEQGLTQAAHADKKAGQTLQAYLRDFPHHRRAAEAWVALAELAFHAAPPRLDEARKNLAQAAESGLNPLATERADYLLIWLEDAGPNSDDAKIIEAANRFLQKHPESPSVSDARMKLAETYYRRQDFSNAQTQFELLTRENPNAPFAEKALFFAAESAMQSMGAQSLDRALVLLDEVVKKNGELKWAARNQQAVIERKLGKPQDAATLYEEVLRGDAQAPEKREALCGKADILAEAGGADPANYQRAIEVYDQLAGQKDVPSHWRNQALFKKGMCLEKAGDRANALATFYKIIEDETRPDRPREFFWFYKAGFNAARLLEDDSRWEPAASVYQKLASAGGARSDEAKSRLSRLRLEHFLLDQ